MKRKGSGPRAQVKDGALSRMASLTRNETREDETSVPADTARPPHAALGPRVDGQHAFRARQQIYTRVQIYTSI